MMPHRSRGCLLLAPLLLASACTTDPQSEAETDQDTSGATETETGAEVDDGHGSVRLEVSPVDGDVTIFDGTAEVVATVQYESCLRDFYLIRRPTLQADGVDGAAIFADWTDRLCSEFDDVPDCEITSVSQNLIEANAVFNLSVTMKINDASSLAYREIHVGPLPIPDLAACESGQQASVEVRQSGLVGRDAMGNQIWRVFSLPASNRAVTDQATPLLIEVGAN